LISYIPPTVVKFDISVGKPLHFIPFRKEGYPVIRVSGDEEIGVSGHQEFTPDILIS